MKITKNQLRRIIKEEKVKLLSEVKPSEMSMHDAAEHYANINAGKPDWRALNLAVDNLLQAGVSEEEIALELRGMADDIEDSGVWSDERDYEAGFKR